MFSFKRSIMPIKVTANEIAALQDSIKGSANMDIVDGPDLLGFTEDSLDGGTASYGSDMMSSPAPSSLALSATTSVRKKDKGEGGGGRKSKLVTGYILYSSEVRKDRAQSNPDCKFGDISRLVGNEWRSLPQADKQPWEDRARKYNEETQASMAEEAANCSSPAPTPQSGLQAMLTTDPLPNQVGRN